MSVRALRTMVRCVLLLAFVAGGAHGQAPAPGSLAALAEDDRPDRVARLAAGARREGTVVLYTSFAANNTERLAGEFEKRYGVKVSVWRAGSDKVTARALAEAKAGRSDADVVVVGAPELEALHGEQVLQAVHSPAQARLMDGLLPGSRAYAPLYLNLFACAYNTNLVRKEELPATLADLLHPRWKGRLGIEAKNQEWFMAMVQDMGEARGIKLFQDIVARNGVSVRNGNSVLTNLVVSGEVPLALTVHSYMPEQLRRRGAPIDWFVIEPAVVRANGIGVLRRAPHPHAALLFYDFMLTYGQDLLADMAYIPAVRREDSPLAKLRVRILDPKDVLDEQNRWSKLYEATLRGER